MICRESVAVFKEYNISCHFTAQRLVAHLQNQQHFFHRQTDLRIKNKASFLLTFKLAKASKPFPEGEFLKSCMVETAGILCPESKG